MIELNCVTIKLYLNNQLMVIFALKALIYTIFNV